LDHFNIKVDNPLNVLQQEEAKEFFSHSDEGKLYDFFLRATCLKDMREPLRAARLNLVAAANYYAKSSEALDSARMEAKGLELTVKKLQVLSSAEGSKEFLAQKNWSDSLIVGLIRAKCLVLPRNGFSKNINQ